MNKFPIRKNFVTTHYEENKSVDYYSLNFYAIYLTCFGVPLDPINLHHFDEFKLALWSKKYFSRSLENYMLLDL